MRTMDAALCLRRGIGGVYGSPLKLFDYMAAGLPVVGTRVGQISEVIEDGVSGYLVGEDDAADVAAALCKLAQDPPLQLLGRPTVELAQGPEQLRRGPLVRERQDVG